jgi:hypothetical protein
LSWAWAIPAGVAAVGGVGALVLAWRTTRLADGLRGDLEELGRLQPALVEARDELTATAVAVRRMQLGR